MITKTHYIFNGISIPKDIAEETLKTVKDNDSFLLGVKYLVTHGYKNIYKLTALRNWVKLAYNSVNKNSIYEKSLEDVLLSFLTFIRTETVFIYDNDFQFNYNGNILPAKDLIEIYLRKANSYEDTTKPTTSKG